MAFDKLVKEFNDTVGAEKELLLKHSVKVM